MLIQKFACISGNIATQPMITAKCADYVTLSFKNRWRALMSVDDVIAETIALVESEGLLENTYFLYSSDQYLLQRIYTSQNGSKNSGKSMRFVTYCRTVYISRTSGFQLGEFNILIDKRQMYLLRGMYIHNKQKAQSLAPDFGSKLCMHIPGRYDHDTRIHLIMRGPGIKAGTTRPAP